MDRLNSKFMGGLTCGPESLRAELGLNKNSQSDLLKTGSSWIWPARVWAELGSKRASSPWLFGDPLPNLVRYF